MRHDHRQHAQEDSAHMTTSSWRRSREVWPDEAMTFADDWSLIDADGEKLARIFDAGADDGVEPGAWRWRVFRPGGSHGDSSVDGRAAKREGERRCFTSSN
jgi:hypothetical protein